jgi:hypothetical protein
LGLRDVGLHYVMTQEGDPVFMGLDGGCKIFTRAEYSGSLRSSLKLLLEEEAKEGEGEGEAGAAAAEERAVFPFFINEVSVWADCSVSRTHIPQLLVAALLLLVVVVVVLAAAGCCCCCCCCRRPLVLTRLLAAACCCCSVCRLRTTRPA